MSLRRVTIEGRYVVLPARHHRYLALSIVSDRRLATVLSMPTPEKARRAALNFGTSEAKLVILDSETETVVAP